MLNSRFALAALAAAAVVGASFLAACSKSAEGQSPSAAAALTPEQRIARGKYIVEIGGCADCHTPGIMLGQKPKAGEEYIGSNIGFRGPWGTSYPNNLRKTVQVYSPETFSRMARTAKSGTGRPPMPWTALAAMTDEDLSAVHAYLKSLGDAGDPAPIGLPPEKEPTTPYIDMMPKNMPSMPAPK